ncbi:MAG: hypothetical protein JNM77_17765 [Pseudonocardia sp.]|nr:hypothetical protein [Pseudonocardia sp.]
MAQGKRASDTDLLEEINTQQESVDAYLNGAKPRSSRLTTVNIVASAVAAALTAGPAMGGTSFTEALQRILSLPEQATVWRVLCLGATLSSMVAAVSLSLLKSDDLAAHVAVAEAARTHLRALQIRMKGSEDIPRARGELADIVTSVPFVGNGHRTAKRWGRLLLLGALAAAITTVTILGLLVT